MNFISYRKTKNPSFENNKISVIFRSMVMLKVIGLTIFQTKSRVKLQFFLARILLDHREEKSDNSRLKHIPSTASFIQPSIVVKPNLAVQRIFQEECVFSAICFPLEGIFLSLLRHCFSNWVNFWSQYFNFMGQKW